MEIMIGNEEYDWSLLEKNAVYEFGFTKHDRTIRMFWEIFHELSTEEKKKFMLFLTGSDRVPVQGMQKVVIRFRPYLNDTDTLPIAQTCFKLLHLPRYELIGRCFIFKAYL
jgi:E3 ubiquitin-protein ligase HERC4